MRPANSGLPAGPGKCTQQPLRTNRTAGNREFRPQQISPAGGSADLELWSSWADAKPVGIQGRLAYRDFVVLSAGEAVNVAQVAGRFKGGKLPDTDWHFALKLDRVVTENGSWPASNLEFVIPAQTGLRHALSFDYLNLADLNAACGRSGSHSRPNQAHA